jgi:cytoskeletal protein RodZ
MAKFLAESFGKKKAGGEERPWVLGSRKLAVAMFTLIGGGMLGVARHYGAAKSSQREESPAPSTNSARVASPAIASSRFGAPHPEDVEDKDNGQTQPATLSQTSTVVTVESGQTLGGVSLQYLGRSSPEAIREIQTLNPEIRDPDLIIAGKQIRLPAPTSDSHGSISPSEGDLNRMETQR